MSLGAYCLRLILEAVWKNFINGLLNYIARNKLLGHIRDIIERGIQCPNALTHLIQVLSCYRDGLSSGNFCQLVESILGILHFIKIKNVQRDITEDIPWLSELECVKLSTY